MPLSATAAFPAGERGPVLLCALRRLASIRRALLISEVLSTSNPQQPAGMVIPRGEDEHASVERPSSTPELSSNLPRALSLPPACR